MFAKRRIVVTFGLAWCLRVSRESIVSRMGGVMVAKRRTVVAFGLELGRRVSKVGTVTGINQGVRLDLLGMAAVRKS